MLQLLRSMLATRNPAQWHRTALAVEALDERLVPAVGLQNGVLVVSGTNYSDSIVISDDYSNNFTVSLNGQQVAAVAKSRVWQNTVRVYGSSGNDTIRLQSWVRLRMDAYGGYGDDQIWGGSYNDQLYGDDGNDRIYGDAGSDLIRGGAGNDVLFGQDGNDTLMGEDGNDTLYGGAGKDDLYGGFGTDYFFVYNDSDSVFDSGGYNWVYRSSWSRV